MDGSREWRRVEVCVPAEVELISAPEKQYSCQVININPDGLCVCGCDEIRSGQDVYVVMDIPAIGKTKMYLKVVWAGWFDNGRNYRAGGKFQMIEEKEKDKFLRFYHLKIMSLLGG